MKVLTSLLCLAGAVMLVSGDLKFDVNLAEHMEHLATQRFPSESLNQGRLDARQYIKDSFRKTGLRVKEQHFNTSVNTDPLGLTYDEEVIEGVNVIGIVEGVSNKKGAVLVVGADYDTNGADDPMFNNGAGVAALLEAAYLFYFNTHWSGKYVLNYTTIFVAFDLNTKEHVHGSGMPGGRYFVQEWLWPFLNRSDTNFGGAFILDSIMNVNYNADTQAVDEDFKNVFPDTSKRVEDHDFKGDFLGLVTMENDKNIQLRDQFSGLYNKDRQGRPFRLEEMTLKRNVPLNQLTVELTKQETIHFWTFQNNQSAKPLPAVLLTDTQALRDRPAKPDTCNKMCRPKDLLTDERVEYMEATVKGLTRFLMRRQGSRTSSISSAGTSLPSIITVALVLFIVRLYY